MPNTDGRLEPGPRHAFWRHLVAAAMLSLLLAAAVAAWAGWNALNGARDLREAASLLRSTRVLADGSDDAERLLLAASTKTKSGRERLDDPVVRMTASLPMVGRPLRTATAVAVAADASVSGALLPLARAAGEQPQRQLVKQNGDIDVAFLGSLREPTVSAVDALGSAVETLQAAPGESGVGEVDEARSQLLAEARRLQEGLEDLALTAEIAPPMLGAEGLRRYLLVPQNPAEARGTGGLVGGFVLLEADKGRVRVVDSGSNRELQNFGGARPPVVDLGAEFAEHYGHNAPASAWVNSNLSPHFPYAASVWRALWQEQSGEPVDGVLALDPIALSYILAATGDVKLADGELVTADNIVELTLRDAYVDFPGQDQSGRKQYLVAVADKIGERLTTSRPNVDLLLPAFARAIGERRLMLWTGQSSLDAAFADRTVSGRLPVGRPVVGDVIVNAAGSKLDYYLDRELTYEQACDGTARLSLRLHNDAPAQGLPEYVSVPQFRQGLPAGTNKSIVTLYVPGDGRVLQTRQDGKAVEAHQGGELGHRWVEFFVTLRPGESAELSVDLVRAGAPTSLPEPLSQPLVRPENYEASGCRGTSQD